MNELASSVVIPTLNEEKYLPRLLESLTKVTTPLQVIVVDGNSTDRTVAVAESFIPRFKNGSTLEIIPGVERNIPLQRNRGEERARYDMLVFFDADVVVPSAEAYRKMLTEFRAQAYAAATVILDPIEPGFGIAMVYKGFHFTQRVFLLFGRAYLVWSCVLTTKDIFAKLGGFDTTMRLSEDADYIMRAKQYGHCGLVDVHMLVSARRFIKYGYGWILGKPSIALRYLLRGSVASEKLYYPFGEF